MNLIYSCVFVNKDYLNLVELLLASFSKYSKLGPDYKYLIVCDKNMKERTLGLFKKYNINGLLWHLDCSSTFDAASSRLKIFDYPSIDNYDKILYLDCDVLISDTFSNIWEICHEDIIYTIQEEPHRLSHFFHYSDQELGKINREDAFTTAVILFKNCQKVKDLFKKTMDHIEDHKEKGAEIPFCLEQPFLIYHAINTQMFDNKQLKRFARNHRFNNFNEIFVFKNQLTQLNEEDKKNLIKIPINHFVTGVGNYQSKISCMTIFLMGLL